MKLILLEVIKGDRTTLVPTECLISRYSIVREALDRRECEEFEMALRRKSKLHVYKELKRGVGFEENLRYVKGLPSRLFFKFRSGTQGLFEELGRHAKGGGSQECPNCGACKESVEHVLFECGSYDSQRQNFLDCMKQVLTSEVFEACVLFG